MRILQVIALLLFVITSTRSQEEDDNLLPARETLNLLRKIAAKEVGDGPKGEPEPPVISYWQTGMTGGDAVFPEDDEEDTPTKSSSKGGSKWKGQIVGRIGVRGLAPIEWNSNTAHQEVLCDMIVDIAGIDETQLEFEEKKNPSDSRRRRLLAFRHSATFSQFSMSYTINARSDQGEADMLDIVNVLTEKIPTREFASNFTDRVLKIEPGSPVKDVAKGGLNFVVSAEAIEAPMVRSETNVDSSSSQWSYSGLNEWSTRESGVVKMGTWCLRTIL